MSRPKASTESQVMQYFKTAPLPEAQLVFGLVKAEMKQREGFTPKTRLKKNDPSAPTLPMEEVQDGR